ncbi:DDE superfamily endonuclease [Nitrosomonas sp. Nm51]|uniref:transposase n=1 Tax=Nitrosomonas sp. Nm51 TaxID=133720 RepID=UPI0008BE1D0B|nr:transposase [Nitrosomonas sp. Nm51]SER72499.1 DDE superfamily endonuclease [Nitrosomonas sp. Nm51]
MPGRLRLSWIIQIHTGASLYKAFEPEVARRLMERPEFVYTPKHGSWLNMAECESSALSRQCLNRRLSDMETVHREIDAWTATRNRSATTIEWRFITEGARIKLKLNSFIRQYQIDSSGMDARCSKRHQCAKVEVHAVKPAKQERSVRHEGYSNWH